MSLITDNMYKSVPLVIMPYATHSTYENRRNEISFNQVHYSDYIIIRQKQQIFFCLVVLVCPKSTNNLLSFLINNY